MHVSPKNKEILEQIKVKQLELSTTLQHMQKASENRVKALKKFNKKKMKLVKYLDNVDHTLGDYYSENAPNTPS